MKHFYSTFVLISFSFFLFNCSDSSKNNDLGEYINVEKEIQSSEEHDLKVEELGNYIENTISTQDVDGYLSKIDLDYFLNKTTHNIGLSEKEKNEFKGGLKIGLSRLPSELSSKVNEGQLYEFISYRYDTSAQSYFMLFRFYSELEGLNYHDYRVCKNGDEFMFNDMYIYLTGENLTQTMKRIVMSGTSSNKFMSILNPSKKKDFNKLVEATKLIQEGDFQGAYDEYNSMQSDMKHGKFVLIMKAQAANQIDEELYSNTIEELMTNHPDDNTLSLNYIDYYLMKEDYKKTIELVYKLKKETGDDFLEYLIGNIYYTKGDYHAAKNHFNYIIKNYPNYYNSYYSYMSCLVNTKEYEELVAQLDKLLTLDYTKAELCEYIESTDMNGENEYEDFIETKIYKKWKR